MRDSKFLKFTVIALIISMMGGGLVFADDGELTITRNSSTTVTAGTDDYVTFQVRNDADTTITDISVTIDFTGLRYCRLDGSGTVDSLEPDETADFSISVNADTPGNNTITLRIEYKLNGSRKTTNGTLTVMALADPSAPTPTPAAGKPDIRLTSPSGVVTMDAGTSKTFDLTFKNISKETAYKFLALILPNESFNVEFLENTDTKNNIGTSNTTNTTIVKVRVTADKDMKSGTYPVELKYTFLNKDDNRYEEQTKFNVKVTAVDKEDEEGKPVVVLSDFKKEGNFNAGNTFKVTAKVKNTGETSAKNVQAVITNIAAETISIYNTSSTLYLSDLAPGASKDISFEFLSNKDLKSGSYPITYKLVCTDKDGKEISNEFSFYVNITGVKKDDDEDKGVIEIISVTTPVSTYNVGEKATIQMTVKNTGVKTAKNIKIVADSGTAVVPTSTNTILVPELAPGATKQLSFSFSPNDTAETKNYSIGFTITYETGQLDDKDAKLTETFSQYVGMNVFNPKKDEEDEEDESKKSIPKIIVSKYAVDPIIVQAGREFDLDISFLNTHSKKKITNIKVYFSVPGTETEKGNVFTPVDASNTFYIDEMAPKSESHHNLRLYTVPDAKAKNYNMVIKFEYEDENGNPYESTEEVGINVKQVSKLEIGDFNINPTMMVGEEAYVSFNVHNTGKVTLYNLKVKFEGEGIDATASEIIYGNFTSGTFDYYGGSFRAVTPGKTTVKLSISYDTDTGDPVKDIREYPVEIMDGGMEGMPGDMSGMPGDMKDQSGMGSGYMDENGNWIPNEGEGAPGGFLDTVKGIFTSVWTWVGIGAFLAAAAVVVTVIVVKVRKKKGLNMNE